jgi:hypothetical protein
METLMDIMTVVLAAAWGAARACGLLLRLAGIHPLPMANLGVIGKLWALRRYLAAASWLLAALL